MTREENERLAVVETEIGTIKECVESINGKLDRALRDKADCTYVEAVDGRITELRGWLWGLVVAVALSLLGTVGALMLALLKAT